jgi:hypothetical protein
MKPRSKTEIVRPRSETGRSCWDESVNYLVIARGMEELLEWDTLDSVNIVAFSRGMGKDVSVCTIDTAGKSIFRAIEDAKLQFFIVIKNKDSTLCDVVLFPTYRQSGTTTQHWEPPWWGGDDLFGDFP